MTDRSDAQHLVHRADCFDSVDAVLIDGANGVCRRPNVHAPGAMVTSVIVPTVAFAIAFALVVNRSRRIVSRRVLAVILLAVMAPGLYGVWIRRPDAPASLHATAHVTDRFVSQVDQFAARNGGCVKIVQRGCVACEPILLYVRPDTRACGSEAPSVVLEDRALDLGCTQRGRSLLCGGGP